MKAKIIKGKFKKLSFKIQEESEFKKKKKAILHLAYILVYRVSVITTHKTVMICL